jgi:hypothetical protein
LLLQGSLPRLQVSSHSTVGCLSSAFLFFDFGSTGNSCRVGAVVLLLLLLLLLLLALARCQHSTDSTRPTPPHVDGLISVLIN